VARLFSFLPLKETSTVVSGDSEGHPAATKKAVSLPPCSPRRCRRRPSAAGGGGVPPFFQPPLPQCSQPLLLGFSSIRFGQFAALREFAVGVDPEARPRRCRPFVDAAVVVRVPDSVAILGSSSRRREHILPCAAAQGMQLQLGVLQVEQCGTWCRQGQIA
jgi:hypothetical protein